MDTIVCFKVLHVLETFCSLTKYIYVKHLFSHERMDKIELTENTYLRLHYTDLLYTTFLYGFQFIFHYVSTWYLKGN